MQKPTLTHKWPVRIVTLILAITLILIPYFQTIKTTLTSAENTITFLEEAGAFTSTATILKQEIQARVPDSVKQNLIGQTLLNKVIDLVITDQTVKTIVEPVVKAEVKLLQNTDQKLSLESDNVVLDLEPYKQNFTGYLDSFDLPEGVTNTVNDFATSIPSSVTIINGDENPNSPVIKLLQLRDGFTLFLQVTTALWVIMALSVLVLIALLYKDIHRLAKLIAKTTLAAGVGVLALSYIAPPIASLFVPNSLTENSGSEVAQLLNSLNAHFFALSRGYVWWYVGVALLTSLVAWYLGNFGFTFKTQEIQGYFTKKFQRKK